MNYTERRKRLRNIFSGNQCHSPASVFDPLSARVAESVGYEIGMLAGSVASNTTLGAPDLTGRSVAIVGCGHVGEHLARRLALWTRIPASARERAEASP